MTRKGNKKNAYTMSYPHDPRQRREREPETALDVSRAIVRHCTALWCTVHDNPSKTKKAQRRLVSHIGIRCEPVHIFIF